MLVLKAIQFATAKHEGQFRKVSKEPYITHPLKVSYLLSSFKRSKNMDELLCSALLHDTLEDTDTTFEEIAENFGSMVASIVQELTNDDEEIKRIGKRDYQLNKMLGMSSYALLIKLVDRLANLLDNPTEKTKADSKVIVNTLVDKRELSKTHMKVCFKILELV